MLPAARKCKRYCCFAVLRRHHQFAISTAVEEPMWACPSSGIEVLLAPLATRDDTRGPRVEVSRYRVQVQVHGTELQR